MKKLLSLALFLISATVFAQTPISLPITWDDGTVDYTTTSFGGNTNSSPTVVDPTNASNSVLKINKPTGAQSWAGTTLGKPSNNSGGFPSAMPFTSTNRFMTIRVRSTKAAGTQMMAKIENNTNGGIFVEKRVNTTKAAGEWENMVFDFGSGDQAINYANSYGKLSFFPDFGQAGNSADEYFVDNVAFGLPPTISSFAPISETSGNTVTISGNNFTGATAVSFGGSPAASFTVVNDNTITAVVGVGASGAVMVTTPVSLESLAGFTFIAPLTAPTITSFAPTSAASGGTVTITGTNFTTATAVNFGGDAAASFTVVNSTTITAVVDLGASGLVAVTNPDGVGTRAGFTYIPPTPTISSFTPADAGGFATVTITGTNFIDVSAVTFGGTAAGSFTVNSPTSITATVGSGASGSVAVTNPGGTGTRAGFTFNAPISLPIDFGNPGVDYTTTDFGGNLSAIAVDPLNGANGVLRITKPAGAQNWAGTTLGKDFAPKVNNGGLTVPIPFTATQKVITARVYSPYPVGTDIRCKVENAANGGISFEVNAQTTVQNGWSTLYWNLSGVNPANTYEKISFFVDFGLPGNAASIFYLDDVAFFPSPIVSSFAPTSAATGATVTITGTNFTAATAVSFGGVAATSFTVVNSTTITAVVGLGASGEVSVTRPGGGVGSLAGFTFIAASTGADVTSFSPLTAGETGVVTISGSNFLTATAVSFGGTAAASFTIVDDNTITATLGAGASGSVSVTNPSGIGALAGFTYIAKSPISLPVTWDSPFTIDYTTSSFGGSDFDQANISATLDVDPTNGSNRVLKVVKGNGAQTWAGTTLGKNGVNNGGFPTGIPFTPSNRFVTAKVYSTRPVGTVIMLKVEQGTAASQNTEKTAVTTVQNAWETLVFDFGAQTGGNPLNYTGVTYDKMSVFCNFGNFGAASANTFYIDDIKFVPGPQITSFTPTSAATGTTVTINGDNFTGATAVSFGGVAATSFTVVDDNTITAVVGVGASGSVSVTTIGAGTRAGFDYLAPLGTPAITSFAPTSSYAGGIITITGSNFTGASAVKFGGTDAASYTIVNSSTITAVVGAGTSGSVSVTNSFGTGNRVGFTFAKKPISLPVLWDDFATVQYNPGDFNGLASVLSTDPLDVSNTVMRLTKPAGAGGAAGSLLGNGTLFTPIPFALGNTVLSVRFYTTEPIGFPVLFKLEGTGGPIEKLVTTTRVGWQVLEFDYSASANISDVYNKLIIFPGFAQVAGAAQVTYIDNIRFGVFPTNVWTGITSNDFTKGSNWSLGFAPMDCSQNVQINRNTPFPAVLASGSFNGGNVNIVPGASLTVNSGATYSICGNLTGGPVTGAGTFAFSGSTAQTIDGAHTVSNVTVNKPASSGNVTINGSLTVSGIVTLANANANLVVSPSASLILASSATGTGSIATIPAGASVNGNVTVQRYLNGTGDGWFLLGGSVQAADFTQWTDDLSVVAGTNLGGTQGVVGLGIQHSSIFKYDDAVHNVSIDTVQKNGWRVPVSGDALTAGTGFRVFLKSYNTPTRIVDNIGNIYQGNFTYPALIRNEFVDCQPYAAAGTVACTETNRGWNLLSNPYPSAINWDAASGWTKPAGMQNGFYRWNSAADGYGLYTGGSYVGAGAPPANPNIIPSGQGFFVKLASGTTANLSMTEAVKSTGSGSFLRTASQVSNALRIQMRSAQASAYSYNAEVRFSELANDAIDAELDAPIMAGAGFHFTMPVGAEELIMNMMGSLNETKIVPMNVSQKSAGAFTFNFSGISSFPAQTSIFIRDNFNGTIQDIRTQPEFAFQMSASENGVGRFELIFTPDVVTSNEIRNSVLGVRVYPNPVTGQQISIELSNAASSASVVLTDMFGRVVMTSKVALESGKAVIAKPSIAAGVYTLKVTAGGMNYSRRISVQ